MAEKGKASALTPFRSPALESQASSCSCVSIGKTLTVTPFKSVELFEKISMAWNMLDADDGKFDLTMVATRWQ